ncbi:MAG: serine--tRNA ligase [Spirochaetaceae bacterium]|nr:serine--tRNA ligase [Myxococcales bacterium]MCB9725879.1 serine--tRNA ligase [Spirochaetaceae bacterium]HPG26193.1 serine--tRNA ligase [Myxococcota bacterium]
MLDARILEERRDEIVESCRARHVRADVDSAIALHARVNALRHELNEANRLRNEHQKAGKQKLDPEAREAHTTEGRRLKDVVAAAELALRESETALETALRSLPNFLHPESPRGGEDDWKLVATSGEPRRFDFEAKDHLALAADLDLVDFERAATVAGQKFYYLKREAALLELALQRFALDQILPEGFVPIVTPDLARPDVIEGLGFSPRGEESQIYSIEGHELCLIGTSEITLGGMYADTIFSEDELPLKLAGVSHCFRTEAGAHGRESRGLYRVHQFTKVEMFVFCRPEDSEAQHAELLRLERRIWDALEIPYRVIDIASSDLGAPAYRKFDLEAWMPGRGESGDWGEITSTSNCTDFQARRLRVRVKREGDKRNELVHTLNGTAISNARAIVAILENHQQADGSVTIPRALVPYVGVDRIGPR